MQEGVERLGYIQRERAEPEFRCQQWIWNLAFIFHRSEDRDHPPYNLINFDNFHKYHICKSKLCDKMEVVNNG